MELKSYGLGIESQQQPNVACQTMSSQENKQQQPGDDYRGSDESVRQVRKDPTTESLFEADVFPRSDQLPRKSENPDIENRYMMAQKLTVSHNEQSIPFRLLLPALKPHLDKDTYMCLQAQFDKLRRNEISKEEFAKHLRISVGDQLLRMVLAQWQAKASGKLLQLKPHCVMPQHNARPQYNVRMSVSESATQLREHCSGSQKSGEVECQPDSHGIQFSQHNWNRSHTVISMQGSSSTPGNLYSGTNLCTPGLSMVTQHYDTQLRQIADNHGVGSNQENLMSISKFTRQNSANDHIAGLGLDAAVQVSLSAHSNGKNVVSLPSVNCPKPELDEQEIENHGNAMSETFKDEYLYTEPSKLGFFPYAGSTTAQLFPCGQTGSLVPISPGGSNTGAPPKKPSIGQKKLSETVGFCASLSIPCKKQKVSGGFLDQSIEQLNDVTAVSGVNLREEEEHLFSLSKDDSRVSELSRRVVQEEEGRLILHKPSLQKKLAVIMAICGLKTIGNGVERCLSLCVEERLRGLIGNLIKLSRQRADSEKAGHQTLITSDVLHKIMTLNHKAREEEWEKRQAEEGKLGGTVVPVVVDDTVAINKVKDEWCERAVKVLKEDEKMRATAANVAARVAVGGDDMLSKWQLMAEQARQKHASGTEQWPGSVGTNAGSHGSLVTCDKQVADIRVGDTCLMASGNDSTQCKRQASRTISIKDVVMVLEREPQMSKSSLLFQLYDRIRSVALDR